MPNEHPNATLIRRLFAALAERDAATALSIIAEDAVWCFPGEGGALAGEHRGREEIAHFLGSVPKLTGGTFHIDLDDVVASDDNAVVLFTGHGERNGKTLANDTALVVRIRDGQAVEFREFVWDLPTVEDFWS
jgi:ketosteroid isomerase-like protein